MATGTCTRCQTPIVVPHCDSRTCTWCRACYDRKLAECEQRKANGK